jgi:TPR repeat protein
MRLENILTAPKKRWLEEKHQSLGNFLAQFPISEIHTFAQYYSRDADYSIFMDYSQSINLHSTQTHLLGLTDMAQKAIQSSLAISDQIQDDYDLLIRHLASKALEEKHNTFRKEALDIQSLLNLFINNQHENASELFPIYQSVSAHYREFLLSFDQFLGGVDEYLSALKAIFEPEKDEQKPPKEKEELISESLSEINHSDSSEEHHPLIASVCLENEKKIKSLFEIQIEQLQKELDNLHVQKDEESQRQWRLKRAEMSKLTCEASIHFEADGDYHRAAKYFYEAFLLGNQPAYKRLYSKTLKFSDKNVLPLPPLDDPKPDLLFYKGLQALGGIGQPKQANLAVQYFQAAAELRYAPAQANLGWMYASGRGVQKDDFQAVHWFRLAAGHGHAVAQHNLGGMYKNGQGVQRDYAQAVYWYRLAADQGLAAAQNTLGWMYENAEGVQRDYAQAVRWYRLAAEQGYVPAQYTLGWMYKNAEGVRQDNAQAVRWYRLAAEQGDASSQNNLGFMYRDGQGVQQDDAEAVHWYRLAAEQGLAAAQYGLGWVYRYGRGVQQDDAEALHWYRLAAEQGHADAQHILAGVYENKGVPFRAEDRQLYRRDHQILKIAAARNYLERLAQAQDFGARYHLEMIQNSAPPNTLVELAKNLPDLFWQELSADSFITDENRFFWMEQLFNEQNRRKDFLETKAKFLSRPRLSEYHYASVCMALARYHYARLSQMAKGHNLLETPKDGETHFCVDLSKLPQASEAMDNLLKILAIISEEHEDYAEAQLISAHLCYIKNAQGPEWKQHLTLCVQSDPQQKWISTKPELSEYEDVLHLLKTYEKFGDSPEDEIKKSALRSKQVSEDSKSFLPLLRLSLLTETPEKRQHYLISLKAVDENFSDSKKWLDRLKKDAAIDAKKEQALLEDMAGLSPR